MSKTISVSDTVWQRLKDEGKKGDSFNDIIERLIESSISTEQIKKIRETLGVDRQLDEMIDNMLYIAERYFSQQEEKN